MELRLSACVLLVLCMTWRVNGGKILVWYTDGSHWINMKPVLNTLIDRGHQVTVLVPSSSLFMNSSEPSRFHYEPFNITVSVEDLDKQNDDYFEFAMYEMHDMSYLQFYIRVIELMKNEMKISLQVMDGVLKSETIKKKLKEGNYDLLLSDPIYLGSDLVADILGIPLVFSLRFSLVPAPPSFVPGAMSKLTDKMDFSERIWSVLFYTVQDVVVDYVMWKEMDKYYSEVKGHLPRCSNGGHPTVC
uniref:Uncharacterized protein n=1 Tax=Acanthochromis polyacanthus TaxID=80966 RepID=A0A3Q1FRZ8_9TELE